MTMQELTSLPESLRNEIQQAASQFLDQNPALPALPAVPAVPVAVENPTQRALAEIARQSPELFALIILAHHGYASIQTVETEENTEDRIFENMEYRTVRRSVIPVTRTRTIRREVRLMPNDRTTIRSRQ